MTAFEEMGVLPEIAKAVEEIGWLLPTDIQNEGIPLVLGGGDVLMAAETGSGKTGAFCLPIIQIVWETLRDLESGKVSKVLSETSPLWTMSFFDRDRALAVTPDGLRCQSRELKEWHGGRATKGISGGGCYYYEATVTDEGLCRVGWSTPQANLDLGTCRFGFGFGGTGKKSNSRQFDEYGEPFGKNDVIGCILDLDASEVRFSKNGVDLGRAFALPPATRTGPFFPAVVLKNAEMSFNFGATPLRHLPAGATAVSAATAEHVRASCVGTAGVPAAAKARNAPQAIVVEPSRELAEQTFAQFQRFSANVKSPTLSSMLVVGGVRVQDQLAALNAGVDIVVATPGRLEDLVSTGQLSLAQCRFFVLDEADGLLKQGYKDLIERLHRQMPKMTSDGRRLQMIVCSATLHDFEVKKLAERLMHFPTWVDLKGEDSVPETVHHVVVPVDPRADDSWRRLARHITTDGVHGRDDLTKPVDTPEILSEAVKILKGEYCVRAIREHKMDRAILFCRTKIDCDNLERYLKAVENARGELSCVCLHGDRAPQERKKNLEAFKRSEVKFLICTDVAARGLDIVGLPFMVNVTLPDEKSSYVHRIGRVGRAERMGLALSLVASVPEKVWYHGQWCASRGKSCSDTRLVDVKGCCMWYNEPGYLAEIEDHLNVTIQQVGKDIKVPANEFDGKVTYGQKRVNAGTGYVGHVAQMAPAVEELAKLESSAQLVYLRRHFSRPTKA